MEREQSSSEVHVVCMPFPAQGHINPMLQFSKRLASKGLKITLVTTSSTPHFTQTQATSSINVVRISDGFKPGEITQENVETLFPRFITTLSKSLADLIVKQSGSKCPPRFLVYDAAMPWALDVARSCGIDGAPLCTTNMAVHAIYYLVRQGRLTHPFEGLPSMMLPGINDLQNESSQETRLNEILNQFSNIDQLNFIFVNTFDKLEDEVVKWIENQLPVKTIGPTIPSVYLDKRLEDDRSYGLSVYKPETEDCIKWLDSKETDSVVYVSFGSWCGVGEEQMQELAWGLKRSNSYFLWVVKDSEETKLPRNFIEETSDEKGMVVSWTPQLEVLAHKSVGCFMTHCGWNSTLEALSLGVPMVAMPQWSEQKMNADLVAEVWEIGVRVRVNEKGIVTKEETEKCIREIMEGERGEQIRRNSEKWKELAKEAVDNGGSSDSNIDEFIAKLASNISV